MFLVTASQMQDMDRQTIESFGIPGVVLMENAGRGAFDFLVKTFNDINSRKVAVVAGRGNNGGDGFVIARYLLEKGVHVKVFLLSSKQKVGGDAKLNLDLYESLCTASGADPIIEIPDADAFKKQKENIVRHDLFVDAILGTGLNSDVRGYYKDAIQLMNRSGNPIFSIDIPSGLHSDTGQPLGIAAKASATSTFAFAKAGHILYPGNTHTGTLDIVDIGIPGFIARDKKIPLSLINKDRIQKMFPPRQSQSHKGSYGHLLIVAGSAGKTGAASLCANAAMRCGTGLVTLGVAKSLNKSIEPQVIEAMTYPLPEKKKGYLSDTCFEHIQKLLKGKQALAIGPGLGENKKTQTLIKKILEKTTVPLIIDADAINCLARDLNALKKKKAPAVLTPHPGEMARLCHMTTKQVQSNRINVASAFAKDFDSILILKGAQTVVSLPDGRSFVCPTGNPGMASGGMGDVLTGMIAGFCAQGFPLEAASLAGVYIHGLCGDILSEQMGGFGFLASDIVENIPKTIHQHL